MVPGCPTVVVVCSGRASISPLERGRRREISNEVCRSSPPRAEIQKRGSEIQKGAAMNRALRASILPPFLATMGRTDRSWFHHRGQLHPLKPPTRKSPSISSSKRAAPTTGCFIRREIEPVDQQIVIQGNRDTVYSGSCRMF